MIINIRGTSGSGKTWLIKSLMDHMAGSKRLDVYGVDLQQHYVVGRVVGHVLHWHMQPVYVVGHYTDAACSGGDTISKQDDMCSLVRHFGRFGHVLFENVVVSTIYSRYVALDAMMCSMGHPYIWAYMDTPLELCIERVLQRRKARGDDRPFDATSTEHKCASSWRTHDKALEAGLDARHVSHVGDEGVTQLLRWLEEDDEYDYKYSYREESYR